MYVWLVAAALAGPFEGASEDRKFGIPTDDVAFSTGFRVVLAPDDSLPVLGVTMRIDAGSVADPEGRDGLAHLVEHLWFRSHAADRPMVWDYLPSLGCDRNAFTSFDVVEYTVACPAHVLPQVMREEGRRLSDPFAGVTQADVDAEVEIVRAERRTGQHRGVDSDMVGILQVVLPASDPYAHTPIGTEHALDGVTLEEVRAFGAAHYTPDKATLVVTGAFEYRTAFRLLFRTFGPTTFHADLQRGALQRRPVQGVDHPDPARREDWYVWPEDPDQPGRPLAPAAPRNRVTTQHIASPPPAEEAVEVFGPQDEAVAAAVWVLPPIDPLRDSVLPFYVARQANYALRGANLDAGCGVWDLRRATLLLCEGELPERGDATTVARRIVHAVASIEAGDASAISPAPMRTLDIALQRLRLLGSLEAVATVGFGRGTLYAGNAHMGHFAGYLRAQDVLLQQATQRDATTWLKAALGTTRAHLLRIEPGETDHEKVAPGADRAPISATPLDALDRSDPPAGYATAVAADRIGTHRLPSGLEVVVVDQGRMPMLDAAVVVERDPAVPYAVEQLVWAAEDDEDDGGGMVLVRNTFHTLRSNAVVTGVHGASGNADDILEALRQRTDRTRVRAAQIQETIGDHRRWRRRNAEKAWLQAHDAVTARLPNWPRTIADLEPEQLDALARIKAKDIAALSAVRWRPAHAKLLIVGAVDAGDTLQRARSAFISWKGRGGKPGDVSLPAASQAPDERLVIIDDEDALQASVTLQCVGAGGPASDLVGDLLDKRVLDLLRVSAGWAYSPGAWTTRRGDKASAFLSATVATERAADVAEVFLQLLRSAVADGFSDEELDAARLRRVLGAPLYRQTMRQSLYSLGSALHDGHSVEDWRQVSPLHADVTRQDARAALAGCLDEWVIAVTADADRLPDRLLEVVGGGRVVFEVDKKD